MIIMQTTKIFKTAWLFAVFSIAGWATTQAQTNATWIGPNIGGLWNTAANWDTGVVPGADANATTNAFIGAGTNVSYNTPMTAAGFGILTNSGVLNVNASGFNCSAITMIQPSVSKLFFITNSGAAVTVSGNLTMGTNCSATLAAGASLTVGSLLVAANESSGANNTTTFTNSGGTLKANSTYINNNSGTPTALLVISGGVNNLGNTFIGRYHGTSASTLGTEGLAIYGGVVTMTNLNVGGGYAASYLTAYITGGTVTNFGSVFLNNATAGRYSRLQQSGGLFVVPDPGVVNPNSTTAGAVTAQYTVSGGTNIVGGFYFGASNSAVAATVTFTDGGVIYVGSQGIASNGAVVMTTALNSGGKFGATADWTGSTALTVNSGASPFTFQAADVDGTPHNITLSGVVGGAGSLNKTGGGTLLLNAANTYSGFTLVNGGALTLGAGGSTASPKIIVGSGTTFDVSAVTGDFVLANLQTLSGSGVVTGAVSIASGGTIDPGSNTLTGTLTFSNSVTETGGAINHFDLAGAPNPNNDFLIIAGDLNVSGTNKVDIFGASLVSGTNYTLIQYGGNFNGGISNFTITTAIGTLTNDATAKTISFIPQATLRGATNTVWVGNPVNTNWDNEVTTNWLNAGALDFFVPGDSVQFTDAGASNSPVNIVGTVLPASVLVNSQSNYVFASTSGGSIGGLATLTVTNTGTLTVLTTNTYTGVTTIDGGSVLAVSQLANGLAASAIGAAASDAANLVINNGTFSYSGPTMSIDRGATLGTASSTINVSASGDLTLGGSLAGNGGLTKTGNGTLVLANGNSYNGGTTIVGGVLQLNSASGASSGAINFNNATLIYNPSAGITVNNPFTFAAGTTNMIIVTSGSSANPISSGDWSGSGVILVNNRFNPYTVNGDLNPFTGTILLTTPLNSTNVFRFNSGGGNTCFGSTNATFDLGSGAAVLTCRNNGTMNLGALQGGSNTILLGQGAGSGTVVWSIGNNNLNTTFAGSIQDSTSSRISSITKIGTGKLTLLGQSTYTGTTTVSNGVLALAFNGASDGSIDSSATINVTPGAFLDVSGRSDPTLQLGTTATQQLRGRGTINGSLNVGGSGTVAPGGGPGGNTGTLTVTNTITLGGTAWMKINRAATPNSDRLISSGSSINYGGTLVVTNIGAPLQVGDTFTLFSATTLNGSFTLALPYYSTWDTSQLTVNGTITVTGVLPFPKVTKADFSGLAGGFITLSATNGIPYSLVSVISSTNLALPLSSWTVVTNTYFDANGNLMDPNTSNPGLTIYVDPAQTPSFYLLQTLGY
jgi:autotransporter-associated beta strand protein